MDPQQAEFRFYEELNDFLPPARRKRAFAYTFRGHPAIKDAIEALGVPHTEVDLVLVNGESVDFSRALQPGDRVAVYPVFEAFDIGTLTRLRPRPLRRTRFVLDVHLGKLARLLRLLGFDARYRRDWCDREIIRYARDAGAAILTRDRGILKVRTVTHGYCIRSDDPWRQLDEVLARFDLRAACRPFTRCTACNGEVAPVAKGEIEEQLPPRVRRRHDEFHRCGDCGRIYWRGTHYEALHRRIAQILAPPDAGKRTGARLIAAPPLSPPDGAGANHIPLRRRRRRDESS
jgi:uncharacterized protein with PIN domain